MKKFVLVLLAVLLCCLSCSSVKPFELENPEQYVKECFEELAAKASDPFELLIYDAGICDITIDGSSVSIVLKSYMPDMTAEISDTQYLIDLMFNDYLDSEFETILAIDSRLSTNLKKAIKKQADQTRQAFSSSMFVTAILELAFDSPREIASLVDAKISSASPEAITLVFNSRDLQEAKDRALKRIAYLPNASELDWDEMCEIFVAEIAKSQILESYSFTFDFEELLNGYVGSDLAAFARSYDYFDYEYDLDLEVSELPSYPAVRFPSSGVLSGGGSGSSILFHAPKDQLARYIQVRRLDNEKVVATFFMNAGKDVKVPLSPGSYYLMIASGVIWYGDEHLFGDYGWYTRSDSLSIESGDYELTLITKTGNVGLNDADQSEFR